MSRLDLVIFGATGFTGKKTVEEIVRLCKKYSEITWGVAGRSKDKLDAVIKEVSAKTGTDLSNIRVIVADVGNDKSLQEMCSQAKVLVNCCGPYRLYGEPVVKAAIDAKCNYVDVSGEPQFMESMQLNYDKAAQDAGVYLVSACGFDSIPNDMGVVFLQQKFGGVINAVESYISSELAPQFAEEAARSGIIHYGTWESLVLGLFHANELPALRKKLYPERLPKFSPKLEPRTVHKKDGLYSLPFPGADNSIVYRTQRFLYEEQQSRPAQFKAYIQFPSLCMTIATVIGALVLYAMSLTTFTRNLLLQYPKVFTWGMITHDGPTENVMNNTKFKVMLYAEGWETDADVESKPPNKKMVAKVCGVNPGYGATVTALLCAALTVLWDKDRMPHTGGVMTSGAAFRNTDLIQRLHENNLTFEIVNTE